MAYRTIQKYNLGNIALYTKDIINYKNSRIATLSVFLKFIILLML